MDPCFFLTCAPIASAYWVAYAYHELEFLLQLEALEKAQSASSYQPGLVPVGVAGS